MTDYEALADWAENWTDADWEGVTVVAGPEATAHGHARLVKAFGSEEELARALGRSPAAPADFPLRPPLT